MPIRRWSKRKDRGVSRSGQDSLCGESGNVLMLHMVTSGPSRGPTSSPHTEDRRSTSQGLSHILCARTCCPLGIHPTRDRERKRIRGEELWQQKRQLLEAVGEQAVKKAAEQLQCDSEYEPGRTLTLEVDVQYFHRRW